MKTLRYIIPILLVMLAGALLAILTGFLTWSGRLTGRGTSHIAKLAEEMNMEWKQACKRKH